MHRSKTWILVLAIIAGLGVTAGCNKTSEDDEKATAKAADKKDDDSDNKDKEASNDADKPPIEATGPVATVNGTDISADKFNQQVTKASAMMKGRPMPPRLANMMKKRTVDRLISEHLIDGKLAEANVELEAGAVDKEYKKFRDKFPSEETFQKFLKRKGSNADEMKTNIAKDLKLRKILSDKDDIEVSDAEVKKYYQDNAKRFEHKEQVHARHILIKTKKDADKATIDKAKKKAEKIAKEAKKPGTDFAKLAKEKSEGPSASRGGDLGFFTRKRMVPAFSDKAFKMKKGEIAGPVKSQFGFHIIKVEGRKEAGKVPFEEAQKKIRKQLKRKRFGKAMKSYLAELKKDAKIERHPDNITVNVKAPKGGSPMGGMGNKMQLKKQIQQKLKQRQQQQKAQGSDKGGTKKDPTKLKLQKPNMGE